MGGFEGWVDRMETGVADILQVATGFVGSNEFQNVYGDLDNKGFVSLLYNNVLGRAADTVGLNGWLAQLDGGSSRAQVVIGFSESAEYKASTATMANAYTNALEGRGQAEMLDDVFRLYRATLGRDPDLGGWTGGADNWRAGRITPRSRRALPIRQSSAIPTALWMMGPSSAFCTAMYWTARPMMLD